MNLLHVLLVPLGLAILRVVAQNTLSPSEYVSFPGGSADFTCISLSAIADPLVGIHWLLNDTLLDDLQLNNIQNTFHQQSRLGTLAFSDISPDNNMTNIRCRAEFMQSSQQVSSNVALLLLQGTLAAVGSLNISTSGSTLSLTWTAPFTLDITGVDPDISGYSVDVVNSTSSSTLHSECVNVTEFSYPTPPDTACHIYTFTVTPVNVVGRGEPSTVAYVEAETRPEVMDIVRTTQNTHKTLSLIMSTTVCSIKLKFVDVNTGDITVGNTNLISTEDNTVTFTAAQLRDNRHYNVTVEASNVAGSATSNAIISTHAITDATITVTPNAVDITAAYFEYSDARGALFSFVQIDSETVNFTRSVLAIVNRDASDYTLPFSLSAGHYAIFVYDIESDGTLSSGVSYPAVRNIILITENIQGFVFMPVFSVIESCHISSSLCFIWAECNYTIVAGFQMTAQLRNSSQVHKLFSGKAISPQTSVAITVEENGIYQVSIIGISRGTGIVESEVEHVQMVPVVVNDTSNDTTMDITAGTTPSSDIKLTGIGIGFGILILFVVILCGVTVAQWRYIYQNIHSTKTEVDLPTAEVTGPVAIGESQLYAEIRDPEPSRSATQNVVTPPSVPAPRGPTSPYYEDVDVPKSGGDYQLTQCDAYGIH